MPCRREPVDPATAAEVGEAIRRRADGVLLLPRPYREAMCWQRIEGWTRNEICVALQAWGGVGREAARRILRLGREMLEIAEARGYPRRFWPRRFPRVLNNPRWNATPLPPSPRQICRDAGSGTRARLEEVR